MEPNRCEPTKEQVTRAWEAQPNSNIVHGWTFPYPNSSDNEGVGRTQGIIKSLMMQLDSRRVLEVRYGELTQERQKETF